MTPKSRQELAFNAIVRLEPGEGWQSRILTVVDRGIGIEPQKFKDTILSLNESNKIQKHYLAGTYGQGGSSTLVFSKYVAVISRALGSSKIAFTIVRYEELPAEEYKTGRYVYLIEDGDVPFVDAPANFPHGTTIRHFGYEFTNYTASIGPKSLYGALQRIMFDPVSSIRLENQVAGWNRTIKGSRNALNGAIDQGDESKGPEQDHTMPMFNVSLGDNGQIGIEYWVLARGIGRDGKPSTSKPSRNFVDDSKPIILTHNGQNQDEMSGRLIKKDADLPFLQAQGRLIVHVNCDLLSPAAKRNLFSSTREQSREGYIQSTIQNEIVNILKSDDELKRLNAEARDQSLKDKDDAAEKQMQQQVAKLLKFVGPAVVEVDGGKPGGPGEGPSTPRGPRQKPEPIELKDPPTFIRFVGDQEDDLTFYGGQRKYIRIETDANSNYHDADDPKKSRINVAVGDDLLVFGTSPLKGGRMRLGVQCKTEVGLGTKGTLRIELYRPGLPTLSDEKNYRVVEQPKPQPNNTKSSFPKFKVVEVDGIADENWQYVTDGAEDQDVKRHASGIEMNQQILYIYYSNEFPRYKSERRRLELQSPALAASFKKRYELWIAVHALLVRDDLNNSSDGSLEEEMLKEAQRQERCRAASVATMMASQEVKTGINTEDSEDAA